MWQVGLDDGSTFTNLISCKGNGVVVSAGIPCRVLSGKKGQPQYVAH